MRSPRRSLRGALITGGVALALSAVLVPPGSASQVSAASYTGYAQGQVMATYDTISYPAMAAPSLKPSVALAAYKGPLIVHANPTGAAVASGLGYEWQCVELVQRYFYGKGWVKVPSWAGVASAYQMSTHIPKPVNGRAQAWFVSQEHDVLQPPVPGDILVFSQRLIDVPGTRTLDLTKSWPDGHVALVTGLSSTKVTFLQQNVATVGSPGGPVALDQLPLKRTGSGFGTKYSIGSASAHGSGITYPTVLGWIHAAKNTGKAPAAPVLVPVAPDAPTILAFTETDLPSGFLAVREEVTWREANPSGVTVYVYGVTDCVVDPNLTGASAGKPCVVEGMKIPSSMLMLIGAVPATVGSLSWDGHTGAGPQVASTNEHSFYGLVLVAANAGGRSPFVVAATSGDPCAQCTF